MATALAYCRSREVSYDPATAVFGHGDAHAHNALTTPGRADVTLIDPDGLFIEPAYDLGILMRDWSTDLLGGDSHRRARSRCGLIAGIAGVDPSAIWEWGFIERVSTGLFAMTLGHEQSGMKRLEVAERLV